MPQYIDQINLERDSIEKRIGEGHRPDQEMAKSGPREGKLSPWPHGIPPKALAHKMQKTRERVGADITQVLPGKER
jgi:hypothetical protein